MQRAMRVLVVAVAALVPQMATASGFRGVLRHFGAHYGEGIHAYDAWGGCGHREIWESVPPPVAVPRGPEVEPPRGNHDLPLRYSDPSAWRWTWPGAAHR